MLVNPNNPTGSYVKRTELSALTALCAPRGVALISDEVFADYALTEDADRVATLAGVEECLAFSMSGLSKVAGLPQMKLGWIVVSGPPRLRHEAFENTFLAVHGGEVFERFCFDDAGGYGIDDDILADRRTLRVAADAAGDGITACARWWVDVLFP